MRRIVFLSIVAAVFALVSPGFADEPAAALPESVAASATEAFRLLDELSVPADPSVAATATYEAIVRAAVPSAIFLPADEWAARQSAPAAAYYAGIDLAEDGTPDPVVANVASNSPAASTGIAPGDHLLAVLADGDPMPTGDAAIAAAAARKPLALAEARALLASGEAPRVTLQVQGATNSVPQYIPIVRAEAAALVTEDLPAAIGYARLLRLSPEAAPALADALKAWQEQEFIGAVLDLRGLSGIAADLPAVDALAALLPARYPDAPRYAVQPLAGQDGAATSAVASDTVASPAVATLPLMVLADASTTGAAERLAAILANATKSTLLIGRATAGDPLLRSAHPFPATADASRVVLLPTATLSFPNGTVLDGSSGVAPDVVISDAALGEPLYEPDEESRSYRDRQKGTLAEEAVDRALRDRIRHDPYLRRATDILLGLRAFAR